MNIFEVREKYPQYSDLSDDQLAQGLHQKFYPDLDFEDFSQRIGYVKTPEVIQEGLTGPQLRRESPGLSEQAANIVSDTLTKVGSAYAPGLEMERREPDTGLIEQGNIDIDNRPVIQNPDGSISTEKSFSIGTDKGEVLIPTIVNGKELSKEDAIKHYQNTGEHLGIFKDIDSANTYAEQLHKRQGRGYSPQIPDVVPMEYEPEREKTMLEKRREQGPRADIAAYAPLVVASGLKGLMSPILEPLKTLGMDTGRILDTAIEFYKKQVPSIDVPNIGVGVKGGATGNVKEDIKNIELQKRKSVPLKDLVGETAQGAGFVAGPLSVSGKAAEAVTAKIAQSARPFYQSILKGMITGGLLGEGKKDETLQNMALFGVFEPLAYAAGKIGEAPRKIAESTPWRKMTIKERGLVVQSLDDVIQRNPDLTEGEILKRWNNPQWRKEALERRVKPEEIAEPIKAEKTEPRPFRENKISKDLQGERRTPYEKKSLDELRESREKLELLNERYKEAGMESDAVASQKAIKTVEDLIQSKEKENATLVREETQAKGKEEGVKGKEEKRIRVRGPETNRVEAGQGEIETIAEAAIKTEDGKIYTGKTHHEALDKIPVYDKEGKYIKLAEDDGFVTSEGRYVTRNEANKMVGNKKDEIDATEIVGKSIKEKPLEDLTKEQIDNLSDEQRARLVLGEEATPVMQTAQQAKKTREGLTEKKFEKQSIGLQNIIYNKKFKTFQEATERDELPFDLSEAEPETLNYLEKIFDISNQLPDEAMAFADYLAGDTSGKEVSGVFKKAAKKLKDKYRDINRQELEHARILSGEIDYRRKEFKQSLEQAKKTREELAEKAKEPWEMTRDEYQKANPIRSAAFRMPDGKIYEGTSHPTIAIEQQELGNVKSHKDFYNAKAGFVTIDGKFVDRDKARELVGRAEAKEIGGPFGIKEVDHKVYVKSALEEGKPVPKEVLAEYPDLQKKAETPKTKQKPQEVSGAFGTQAKSKEATDLIKKSQTLKAERMEEGASKLSDMSLDDIEAMGERARKDSTVLDEMDSLLADVTGGPGNFQKMNWKADDYVEKLQELKKKDMLRQTSDFFKGDAKQGKQKPQEKPVQKKEPSIKTEQAEKPKPIGTAWVGNQWKPILEAKEIKRGKNKGKFRVSLIQKTAQGNRKTKVVGADAMRLTEKPQTEKKQTESIRQELGKRTDKAINEISQAGTIGVIEKGPGYPKKAKVPEFKFANKEYENGYRRSKGKKKNWVAEAKQNLRSLKNKATREYEHLPKNKEFAGARFALLRLSKQKGVASDKTLRTIQGLTIELDRKTYDVFNRKVVTEDLYETAKEDKILPYGLDEKKLKQELDNINEFIKTNNLEQVNRATQDRQRLWDAIKTDYSEALKEIGLDVSDRLKRKNYFRHQILEYANLKGLIGTGKKLKTPAGRSHLKQRSGSELDINTDYLQAEHEVMSQMLNDIEIANTIKKINDNYNIKERLQKEAKTKRENGNDVKWQDLIPEGYTTWQPREGNVFYMADSIPGRVARQLTEEALEKIDITKEDLRKVLAMGGKRKQFVIPEELAATLDNLVLTKSSNVIANAHKSMIRAWKIWQLTSPRRYFKYNLRNLTGDADAAFAGSPKVFSKLPKAIKDLVAVYADQKSMSPDLKDWFERGGMQSTLQFQEMGEINKLKMFVRLQEKKGTLKSLPLSTWQKYWKTARLSTDFREAILRYAAYLRAVKEMKASPDGLPKDFWASNPEEIRGLQDIKDRGFWMSNDLLGAYDRVSVVGQALRDHMFPFWSWKEVNFKRYARMFSNAATEGKLLKTMGRKTFGSATIRTPYRAYRIGKWMIRVTAFLGMLHLWNHTRFLEEEKQLPKSIREKPHVILGRDENGKIEYFSRVGALGDLLEWGGFDQAPQYTRDILDGRMTVKEAVKEMAKQPVNVIIQGGEPVIKLGAEILTRRSLFPDVFKPGVVRDRILHIARSLGVENEYIAITGKPSRGYKESIQKFWAYKVDPDEAAYHDIYGEKLAYMKKIGKYGEGFWITPRGNALYNSKLALKYGDKKSAVEYMAQYLKMGGTFEGMAKSYESMSPVSGLKPKQILEFYNQLSADNKERFIRALKYYNELVDIK